MIIGLVMIGLSKLLRNKDGTKPQTTALGVILALLS